MGKFFDEHVLDTTQLCSVKTEKKITDIDEFLKQLKGSFKVAAFCENEVKLGRFTDGSFCFADDAGLELEFLQELRLFNNEQELLFKRSGLGFKLRNIEDNKGDVNIQCVDTKSNFFGDRVEHNYDKGFAKLWEEGRKISIVVPVDVDAEHYALKTRSYITYDEQTGQAGFGYYRYMDIVRSERG